LPGAPDDATLVVFHTAVLAYVADAADKQRFADRMSSLCSYWLCNEAPGAFPEIAKRATVPGANGRFLLSLNGSPVAWTDPHGRCHRMDDRVMGEPILAMSCQNTLSRTSTP